MLAPLPSKIIGEGGHPLPTPMNKTLWIFRLWGENLSKPSSEKED